MHKGVNTEKADMKRNFIDIFLSKNTLVLQ